MTPSPQGRVSVIIPARNEEANIERAVRSVAAQDLVREIIVVDDGSTDRTGEILDELRTKIAALRSVRVEALPDGWTGKTHACALGAKAAGGEWLLFTDADAEHLPGSLGSLIGRAESESADLLSLSPGQETPTWWEKAVIPRVFVQLARWYPFEEVSRADSARAAANGQYLLVRRKTYGEAGGFEGVRGAILDDVALAERVKAKGAKTIFLPGAEWARTRMYRTFGAMWQGWTKNLYLLARRRIWNVLAATAEAWLLDVLPWVVFVGLGLAFTVGLVGDWSLMIVVAALLVALLRQWSYRRDLESLKFSRHLARHQAAGSALFGLLLVNSFRVYRLGGSIEWKGRRYAVASRKGRE